MLSFTNDALRLIRNYVKNVETELRKFKVDIEPKYLKIMLFDLENAIKILSMITAMKRKSSKAEVIDVQHTVKNYGRPEEFINSHFKDVAWLNSHRIIINNLMVIKHKLQKTKMPKVLDAGCGWGRISKNLSNYCSEKFEIIGVDLDKLALQFGKTMNEAADFIMSDIQTLPFKNQVFDLILCSGVMHEIKSERGRYIAAQEFSRILKPKGMLHITDRFAKLQIISTLTRILQYFIGKVEWISRKDQLEKILKQNAFRIISVEKESFYVYFHSLVTAYTFMAVKNSKAGKIKVVSERP